MMPNGPFPAASAPSGNPLEPAPPATAELRLRMLRAVDDEALTWTQPGMRAISYRLWLDEKNYRTLTKAERRAVEALIAGRIIRTYMAPGFSTRGGIKRASRSVSTAALVQVGWMVSEDLAAEFGITPLSNDYLLTIEQAERDGGIKPEHQHRVIPVYRKASE